MRKAWVFGLAMAAACGGNSTQGTATGDVMLRLELGTGFYAAPYPMDGPRFDAAARRIDLSDFPNPFDNALVRQVLELASTDRDGFGLFPVVSFGFTGRVATDALVTDLEAVPTGSEPAFFVNVDPEHPRYGERVPAIAAYYADEGNYVDANVLTLAPWPGRALAPSSRYAAVVLRRLGDAEGLALRQAPALRAALAGDTSAGDDAAVLAQVYAPLAAWLAQATDVTAADVAAATVFTTGDPVAKMYDLVQEVLVDYRAETAQPLQLVHHEDAFCYYEGAVTLPQFQAGEAPFSEPGSALLVRDTNGRLVKQRDEVVKVTLVIPKTPMPDEGFAYVEYVHGSGGIASQIVDRGPELTVGGGETPWRGPGYVVARRGLAAGSQAMPASPDRVPGAGDFDYFQITNLATLKGDFQQGTLELALKHAWLYGLELPASSCPGANVPGGTIRLNMNRHATMGQSMGAMYTNLYGAVATDTQALVPTGSGGYWSFFLFSNRDILGEGVDPTPLLATLLGLDPDEPLSHLHPLMGLFQQYVEAVDPIVFVGREIVDPLPQVPAKHLYVPHGYDDIFFSRQTQRAIAVGYGVPRVGDDVQDALMDQHLALFFTFDAAYPLRANRKAGDGTMVTAAQVQFPEDPIQQNGHTIYAQRDEVRFQYGCFLQTFAQTGVPTIVAPNDGSDPFAACE